MKKFFFVFAVITLVSATSCDKHTCWVIRDCMGNDIGKRCCSDSDIQTYCASQSSPGCAWTYKKD
ncbi:MAG: hypothetical protein IPL54_04025 [Chitinophagaceae bacterium]|nr:hypothetical protein [Chitinophagaceae bacterium]